MSQGLDVILYIFVFLSIGVLSRQFVVRHGISLPVHTFMVMAGIFLGLFNTIITIDIDPLHLDELSPETPFNIYMCILMFDCAFNTEVNYLKLILYHMATICIPTIVLTNVLICLAGVWLFPYSINVQDCLVMTSVILIPGPHMMKAYLAPTNVQQDLKTLMEAEAMFGNYISFMIFKTVQSNQNYNTAIASIFLDILIGGVIGFMIGKLMLFWISKIFKDFVNQTTIVLAFSYAGYALSYLMTSKGFLCVITIGLVLSHRRSSMSSHFIQILNAVLELIIFSLTTLTCVSAGVYFVTITMNHITLADLVTTLAIFIIQNATRGFVLFLAYQMTAKHLLTKTNTVILWACNIRGSYALMMGFTLLEVGSNTVVRKIFVLIVLQIFLSFVANSLMCSYVIGYLNEDTLSKKRWMIERAARLIIAIRKTAVDSLRNVVSIADADWNVVIRQTKLKSDFMTAYRYARWLNNHGKSHGYNTPGTDPVAEMRHEAIRQINLSEKACYSKLYAEGMLSRQSVMSLMYLVNNCLKAKRLLEPSDIFKEGANTSFLNRLAQELANTIKKGPPPMCIRIIVLFFCCIDIFAINYAIMFVLFDDLISARLFVITGHNVMMFCLYFCLVVFFTIKNRSLRSGNLWQFLYRIVVVVTFLDLLLTASPLLMKHINAERSSAYEVVNAIAGHHYKKIFKTTIVFCILTRLLRSLCVVEVIPVMQLYMLNFVTHMQDKELFIECDMATGYIRVITETLSKLSNIITDRTLVMELKYLCHKNKLETAQHLCLTQLQHPNVMAALKTKYAMRLVLNTAEHALIELKEMGVLGEMDSDLINKDILAKMVAAQNFPYFINTSSVRALLLSIPWIDGDYALLQKIENVGNIVKFYANDIITGQGYLPEGIFIILQGVVRMESIRQHVKDGNTEKVPYFCIYSKSKLDASESATQLELHGFCTRGNVIGEMAFLEEKPGHKTYRCATYVETYFVSSIDLSEICERDPDKSAPLSPLEKKIWRVVAIRQAVRIIHKGASSFNLPRLSIFSQMSESYIVDGNSKTILSVQPNEVAALILIHGYVSQCYTELRYVGPCILPYNQLKFISHPELGPRVIYLILQNLQLEDNTLDGLVPEEPQMADYEDSLTISSGSSDLEPYRRKKDDVLHLQDESDFSERMFTSGMNQKQISKVKSYKVRQNSRVTNFV